MGETNSRSISLDRILSLCAIIAAVFAVAVAVYEVRTTRQFQEISLWPYITQGWSRGNSRLAFRIGNHGTGPALVRSFEVRVDSEPVSDWFAALDALTGETTPIGMTSVYRGTLVPAGEDIEVFSLPLEPLGERVFQEGIEAGRIETGLCYCSLYGTCWLSSSVELEPEQVRACPESDSLPGDEP